MATYPDVRQGGEVMQINKRIGGWFYFNGEPSYKYGVVAEQLPNITRPARRVETVTVPGADGIYHIDQEAYEPIVKTAQCSIMNGYQIENISTWLLGAGRVIFANEPQFYYNAFISNAIDFAQVYRKIKTKPFRFPVVFTCQPIKHNVNEIDDSLSITTSGKTFRGKGNVSAKPIITVYGSGTIGLTVNSTAITLTSVSEYITINSVIMDAYKGSVNANLQMSGEFPLLYGGGAVNTISYSGSVTKIEITPNWGWI